MPTGHFVPSRGLCRSALARRLRALLAHADADRDQARSPPPPFSQRWLEELEAILDRAVARREQARRSQGPRP